ENDKELVAAVAGDDILITYNASKQLAQVAQDLIAFLMTEVIVDRLKAVQIEAQQSKRVLSSARRRQRQNDRLLRRLADGRGERFREGDQRFVRFDFRRAPFEVVGQIAQVVKPRQRVRKGMAAGA